MFFQGDSICSLKRPYFLFEQILITPPTHTNFPGASIFSSNRYPFSRKPYLVLEHIRFSRRLLWLEQIRIFQEGTPRRTDISLIGNSVAAFERRNLFPYYGQQQGRQQGRTNNINKSPSVNNNNNNN